MLLNSREHTATHTLTLIILHNKLRVDAFHSFKMFVFNQQKLISREFIALTTSIFPGGQLKSIVIHLKQRMKVSRSRVQYKASGYFAFEYPFDTRHKILLTGVI